MTVSLLKIYFWPELGNLGYSGGKTQCSPQCLKIHSLFRLGWSPTKSSVFKVAFNVILFLLIKSDTNTYSIDQTQANSNTSLTKQTIKLFKTIIIYKTFVINNYTLLNQTKGACFHNIPQYFKELITIQNVIMIQKPHNYYDAVYIRVNNDPVCEYIFLNFWFFLSFYTEQQFKNVIRSW